MRPSTFRIVRVAAATMILMLATAAFIHAQQQLPQTPLSLDRLLTHDGHLRTDQRIAGQLDLRGWRMRLDRDGRPRFVRDQSHPLMSASDPQDIHWDDRFATAGPDNALIDAIAASGDTLYVIGEFSLIGGVEAQGAAMWDGKNWSALGGGVDGYVVTMAVGASGVYVGGILFGAGGQAMNGITRWDGKTWSSLGADNLNGVNGFVQTILVSPDGDNVYVGGSFTFTGDWFDTTGAMRLNNIGVWNRKTNTWSQLKSGDYIGVDGYVTALALQGSNLYVGGLIDSIDGSRAGNLAKWSMASKTWRKLSDPDTTSHVNALRIWDGVLYVGGSFDAIGGIGAKGIATWDIATEKWSVVGVGPTNQLDGDVRTIDIADDGLYVSGFFSIGGDTADARIARWDKSVWSLSPLPDVGPEKAAASGAHVYVEGRFKNMVQTPTGIQMLRDNAWVTIGEVHGGGYGSVNAIALVGDDVFIGGTFSQAGGLHANGIARWNRVTNTWSLLGVDSVNGVDGYVNALAVKGRRLYVGGTFAHAGAIEAKNIAAWDIDREEWEPLGVGDANGVNSYVSSLAINRGALYVGGSFDSAGGQPAIGVAVWNADLFWKPLGLETISGVTGASVDAMAVTDSVIYLSGWLTTEFGSGGGVIKWKFDESVQPYEIIALDLFGSVNSIAVWNGDVYIGGDIREVGGRVVNNLAKWDGVNWSAVGESGINGVNGVVTALGVYDNKLYVGGAFDSAGSTPARGVVAWDGESWSTFGSGVNNTVNDFAFEKDGFFVVGAFTTAGGKLSLYIGRWNSPSSSVPTSSREAVLLNAFPNPSHGDLAINFTLTQPEHATVTISDQLGRTVATIVDDEFASGDHRVRWDAAGVASGVYLCTLRYGDHVETVRVEVVR